MNSEQNNNYNLNNQNINNVNNSVPVNNFIPNQTIANNQMVQNYNLNNFEPIPKKSNKKIILIVLALIIMVLGGVAFFYFKSKNNIVDGVNLNHLFDPDKPILIEKNDKYGYISSEGKTIVEPKYLSATSFKGNYAVVSLEGSSEYLDLYQIIDKKGKVKFEVESYSAPKYYSEYDIWVINGILYNGNLKQITKDGITVDYAGNGYLKWDSSLGKAGGIMNYKGKITYTYNYLASESYISVSSEDTVLEDKYCIVNIENEKYAIVNCETGKVVFDYTKDYISNYGDNVFRVSNHDTFSRLYEMFINDDKVQYKSNDDYASLTYKDNGYLKIYDIFNGNYAYRYLDIKTGELLEDEPESESENENDLIEKTYGYKPFESSGKYGIMKDDKVVLPCEYDGIGFLNKLLYTYLKNEKNQEIAYILKDEKISIINLKNQKVITTFNSNYVSDDENSTFIRVSIYEDGSYSASSYIIYNILTGKSLTIDADNSFDINSNYVTIEKDSKRIYYNTELEQIYVKEI